MAGALRSPSLADGVPEILAGAAGLDTPLRWVHSVESPGIASLLRGGELLLMTGIGLPNDEAAQRRFVASLAERQVAGVVIELGTAFTRVPRALVSEAEAHALPLIALHREVPFVEVTEALHREIVNRQALALQRGDEAHRRFTELVLDGAGVAEILEALADLIGNPVVLEKLDQGVVYHEAHRVPEAALHAAWDAAVRGLSAAPARISVEVHTGHQRQWGTLHALAMSAPLHHLDRVVVNSGAEVIALTMLRNRQEQALAGRERGNFIATLMNPAVEVDEREAGALAADLGFDRGHVLRLPVVAVTAPGTAFGANGSNGAAEAAWASVWEEVTEGLAKAGIAALTGLLPGEEGLGLVVALASPRIRSDVALRVSRVILDAAKWRDGRVAPAVCVGPVERSWSALGAALRDAVEVGRAAAHAPARPWHDATAADINRLFWALRADPAMRGFVRRRLDPLIEYDREHRSQFAETLEAYLDHGGRMAETARALHLGRQSVYKRIARIEELLGGDLSDPELRLGLHLALRARRYLQGQGSGAP